MDMRYVVSALIGAFCLFAIFAAITTARRLSQREGRPGPLGQNKAAKRNMIASRLCHRWVRIGAISGEQIERT
jgi:hypothetical protein